MINQNLEKLKNISSELTRLTQLANILNTYLDANQVYNEQCSNALILSEIIVGELEKIQEHLFDYLHQIHIEIYNNCKF